MQVFCAELQESDPPTSGGMTLLAQLSTMPSMSALIDSPVPSVGSVVPNMQQQSHPLNPTLLMANGLAQQPAPEVRVQICVPMLMIPDLQFLLHVTSHKSYVWV